MINIYGLRNINIFHHSTILSLLNYKNAKKETFIILYNNNIMNKNNKATKKKISFMIKKIYINNFQIGMKL
ncbi:hypothetical protein PFBG_01963 [Plasmodium falciparum 7G8]|uniref:Uncharacterized protein n=2 Tax=Plasmodium falciparum TaxID=5833 RepID=A0A024W989_PLAFA|nr:hypothetical protein PFTANZ_02020 [Plasmodium falciparum Tanzania (2000708)]EUR73349.1 hypothetical protein PFBG_01963 [Plasmodium falciparum 7G8]